MGKVHKPKIYDGLIDTLKKKAVEIGVEYFKKNIETTKKELMRYAEKTIERKIKKEVRKYTYTILAMILLAVGGLFLLFGIISLVVSLLGLPSFISTISFGILLLISGMIVYLMK